MKVSTTIVASAIARAPERIVSAPSCGLMRCSLIGSAYRAAGRLPAFELRQREGQPRRLRPLQSFEGALRPCDRLFRGDAHHELDVVQLIDDGIVVRAQLDEALEGHEQRRPPWWSVLPERRGLAGRAAS